ncbi:hypothetical protein, partial [uncultured Oscillibacter sp.]|uniref:hypothetical protein n=1 Tax=uncultured Oscillibacter sp. TaxID=876091 RepID=UPI0025F2A811
LFSSSQPFFSSPPPPSRTVLLDYHTPLSLSRTFFFFWRKVVAAGRQRCYDKFHVNFMALYKM